MKGSLLAAVVMVVGLLVLFVGPLVLVALPTGTYWTDADQEKLQKASSEAHAATYGADHDDSKPHAHGPTNTEGMARVESTRAQYEIHNTRLKAARASRDWLGIGCRVLGLLLAAAGVILYVRAKRLEAK